jgi:DNA processing protein
MGEASLAPGWFESARAELRRAQRFGARILTLEDEEYPALLRATSDPPPTLYLWGRLRPEDMLAVAVVGSRRATPHGASLARRIAGDLAARGFCVVSGLARGIDAAGHRGALEAEGRTVAVLGSGLDRIYPAEHRKLAEAIAGRGAVLTEFPFGTPPLRRHFPERNRVIAWLSWATVVIEAARDSGSLITAGLALDEGRSVHAVPGLVGRVESEGTNALLRDGAHICRGAEDVLEDLAPQLIEAARLLRPDRAGVAPSIGKEIFGIRSAADRASLTADQRSVLECLRRSDVMSIERLGEVCGMGPGPLLAALLELELLGLVRQLPGRFFVAPTCNI